MSDAFRTVSADLEMMINRAVESHQRITELEAELAALREANRWIPVGERLPEAGVEVLIYCAPPLAPYWVGHVRTDGVWVGNGGVGIRHRALAWRPMPAPPKVEPVTDVPPEPAVLMDALHGAVHKDEGPEHRGRLRLRSRKTEVEP